MNTFLYRIVFITLMMSAVQQLKAHVALDYPLGGETFIVGEVVTIQWHIAVPHTTLNWDLFFSSDAGVTWDTLQLNIPTAQTTYSWVVPDILTEEGRIRIFMDNEDQDYLDISMDFTIAPNTMPPSLDAPAQDTILDCGVANQQSFIEAWLDNHGGASATNFCEGLEWTHDFSGISNDCGNTGSTMVIFSVADDCGVAITSAMLTIRDITPPVLQVFASNKVVESNGQGNLTDLNSWLNNNGGASAMDGCGTVSWTNNYSGLSDGCGSTGSANVTFTTSDQCGNIATTSAIFTIQDTKTPVIDQPAQDTLLECDVLHQQKHIQNWIDIHGGAHAFDIGSEVIWIVSSAQPDSNCGSSGSLQVLFNAVDACGNSSGVSATVSVEDHAAPVIDKIAQDTSIECGRSDQQVIIQSWLSRIGGAHASDLCGDVIWTNDFPSAIDTCGAPVNHIITFIATDECLNSSATTATLTILEETTTASKEIFDERIKIFPNPVSDVLTIIVDELGSVPVRIRLVDSYGRTVLHSTNATGQANMSVNEFAAGIYILQISMKDEVFSRKIVFE